ncbi:MAG: sugar transferase [Planctomycetota bacterium]
MRRTLSFPGERTRGWESTDEFRRRGLLWADSKPYRRAALMSGLGGGLTLGSVWLSSRLGGSLLWTTLAIVGGLLLLASVLFVGWTGARRREGRRRRVLVLGNNRRTHHMLRRWLDAGHALVAPIGFLDDGFEDSPVPPRNPDLTQVPRLGGLDALPSVLSEYQISEVLIALPLASQRETVIRALRLCWERDVPVRLPGEFFAREAEEIYDRKSTRGESSRFCVSLDRVPARFAGRAFKRVLDFAVSGTALLFLSPLMCLIALSIKLTSPGPIFFRQVRSGLHNRPFITFKFRSMRPDAEAQLAELMSLNEVKPPVFKMKNDPRLTHVGRWLRRTSLDELPQLFNIFRGEMSLVGPRPPVPSEVSQYTFSQRRRLTMKPGLTCIWQVSGRSEVPFEQWMEMDLTYIDTWSWWLDIKLLVLTVPAVLSGRGAM